MKTGVLHSRKQVFLYLNYRCVLRLKLKDSLIVFSNIVSHCTCRERSPYNSFTYFSLVLDRASSEFKANIYTMSANLINLTLPFFLFFFFPLLFQIKWDCTHWQWTKPQDLDNEHFPLLPALHSCQRHIPNTARNSPCFWTLFGPNNSPVQKRNLALESANMK